MDERTAKRLRAAADHARRLAAEAGERVARMEAKADRARIDHEAADRAASAARTEESEARQRAAEAERAVAAAGLAVTAHAGTAAGTGGV